jgi:FKBP-type peptidyl-prolyl cis-trans isomerase FkpA
MNKIFILVIGSVLFSGCIKSSNSSPCTDVPPADETAQIQGYCALKGINYLIDTSGIYYEIVDPGDGAHPTTNSIITTSYVGKLLDDRVIDSSSYTATLSQLIAAWQITLPKIAKGGRIKMVAPSSLCYGCYGIPPTVPSNAILYFDITLTNVQ